MNLRVRSAVDVRLKLPNGPLFRGDELTLPILETFASARTTQQAVDHLRQRFTLKEQQSKLKFQITALLEAGFLREVTDSTALASGTQRFDAPAVHIRMLNDRARTSAFQQAIREQVTADDIVLDIGTGTGILAATAARSGVKHVYAVEQSSMADVAARFFAANGLSDRITVIRGRSTDIDLPQRASVLVSEIIGNDPLHEFILPVTADAIRRHLTPEATLIPRHIQLFALPVSIPQDRLNQCTFAAELTSKWQDWYGLDFSSLAEASRNQNHSANLNTYDMRHWKRLSDPIPLSNIDLRTAGAAQKSVHEKQTFSVRAIEDGLISGILIYFEARLNKNVNLSIHPENATEENHWGSHLWIAGRPAKVTAGTTYNISWQFKNGASHFEVHT